MTKEKLIKDLKERMKKTTEATWAEFASIRTGRASASLLDHVKVDYYGTQVPVASLSTISTPEPRLIVIKVWDKNALEPIYKAILKSDLGLTPTISQDIIKIPIPTLTDERRKDLTKIIRKKAEEGKIALRQIRREVNAKIDAMEDEGIISEDECIKEKEHIQRLTDEFIKKIDDMVAIKEKEIWEA